MSIKFIDGFDQYQGQAAQQLLSSLTSAGYAVTSGLAMGDGRKDASYALELQVATGVSGKSWSTRTNNVKNYLSAVAISAAGHYIAAGVGGVAVYSDDSLTWLPLILGVSNDINDMKNSGNTWVMTGALSTILRSTDGRNFSRRPAPVLNANTTLVETDGNGVWLIAGSNGSAALLWKSVDDGVTWSPVVLPSDMPLGAVRGMRYANGVWMLTVGTGKVMVSSDTLAWTLYQAVATNSVLGPLDCDSDGTWLAAAGATLWRSLNNGASWANTSITPTGFSLVSLRWSSGRWMCGGASNGSVLRLSYSDDSLIWEAVALTGWVPELRDIVPLPSPRNGWVAVGGSVSGGGVVTGAIGVSLAPPTTITKTFNVPVDVLKFTVGFAHMANTRGKILSIAGVVDMDWPSFIAMGGVSGAAIPARNVWYYYEITIDRTAKTATLHINDTLDITCPLTDPMVAKTSYDFQWQSENGAVSRIDDIYFVDDRAPNAETLLDRLGPINIPLRLPTADSGPNDWSPATAGAEHWSQVGLLPPSQESFIRSATSGAQDLFTSDTPLPDGAGTTEQPILAVGVVALAMKGDIDNRQIGLLMGAAGPTQKEIIDTTLSVVPEYSYAVFEKAPGNVDWDASNTVSTPFGVAVRP